ncbi:glycosyltransferase family 87 protein [Roseibium algae]|uniref:Glycosyltransferase family 87 protein n=1 Tax=Roseibium algae TaxID=3123038 RepID=A0ABU8THC4_9HYPH
MVDYVSFWLAGKQVLLGTPELPYIPIEFVAIQKQFSGSDVIFGFFYPPTFQMLQVAFALLPYKAALVAFAGSTTFLLFFCCRLITGNWLLAACLILIPACGNNLFHGQNAALTASLYALFLIGMERNRIILAGIALGILTIKPQLGILVPIALIAARDWRIFLTASVATLALVGLSFAALGLGTWQAFWQQVPVASAMMELGGVEWGKMISVYGAVRLFDFGHASAILAQIAVGIGGLGCVWVAWSRSKQMVVRAPVLIAGTLLATPFGLSYDLTLLVVPCAFLIREGLKYGFLPYEKMILAIVICLSASTSPIAIWLGIPVAPLLPALILSLGMRRLKGPSEEALLEDRTVQKQRSVL